MSNDLARLRRNGLIERLPHSNTYVLTPKANKSPSSTPKSTTGSCDRCSRLTPTGRTTRRDALWTIDRHVQDYAQHALRCV